MSEPSCQAIHGAVIDEAIGDLVIEVFKPSALEVSLAVQDEIKNRLEEVDRHHRRHVERAQYEADMAQRRFMKVDPENRLVAENLEADWNEKLRILEEAKRQNEAQKEEDLRVLDEEARKRIMNLAEESPVLWKDQRTPVKERKRMLALLIEDVTLIRKDHIVAHVRFRRGATRTLNIELPLNAWQKKCTNPKIVQMIDQLLEKHTDGEVAKIIKRPRPSYR